MHPSLLATFNRIIETIRTQFPDLTFEILEIGSLPMAGLSEPFHRLLDDFPGSRVHSFELDSDSCATLMASTRPGVIIHPAAIGLRREKRTVHLTHHPMCTSLYRPNEKLMQEFNNLEFAHLRSTEEVETVSLDELASEGLFDRIDFVKIDIQGAERDAFRGASKTLRSTVAIVTEVEFFHHYEDQPLFGDVDQELRSQGFMLHKFIGLAGRTLRPVVIDNNPNHASWHLWSDAMYVTNLVKWPNMEAPALARLAILAFIYNSPDITFRCLQLCDQKYGTYLATSMNPI